MDTTEKRFFAKILLFGEYSLMHGSNALSVPCKKYHAEWRFPDQHMDAKTRAMAIHSNKQLNAYKHFVLTGGHAEYFSNYLHTDAFEKDLANGVYLYSNIPSGYGLGSSGALVAAVYDRYKKTVSEDNKPWYDNNPVRWKPLFARMESFFHGNSSGIDPLAVYLGRPLLIGADNQMSILSLPVQDNNGGFFLVNTQIPRKTANMMAIFSKKMGRPLFADTFLGDYLACNDRCIRALFAADPLFTEYFQQLSNYQWQIFQEMIPDTFRPAWRSGLTSQNYALKLCGAGGGGYILGYTPNYFHASEELRKQHIRLAPILVG